MPKPDASTRGLSPLALLAGGSALLASPLAFITLALGVLGAGASIDVLADPTPLLRLLSGQIDLLRWANLCSLFGYGLLLVPMAVHLYDVLYARSPGLARLAMVCGLGYIACAITNAVVLLSAWPVLQQANASLDPTQRPAIEVVFRALTDTAEIGVEAVMYIFGGGWWLLVGYLLGTDRGGLRWTTLGIAFVLIPVWAAWIGLRVLGRA